MRIHRVTLDTRNFHFEAYGSTKLEARVALDETLRRHADDFGLADDWMDEYEDDAFEHFEFEVGEGFRDRHVLVRRDN
jgi:hypothetical protein